MHRYLVAIFTALIVLGLGMSYPAFGADESAIWQEIDERSVAPQNDRLIIPQAYRTFALNQAGLRTRLATAPLEEHADGQSAVMLPLPLPDGTISRFVILESPIMEPELAARYPEIKTYIGQGLDDPTAVVRFDWTPAGFHAMILSQSGTIFIDPYSRSDTTNYISYFERDYERPAEKVFEEQLLERISAEQPIVVPNAVSGTSLRTYRLAMAATGEYTAFHGGSVQQGLSAIVTSINRVNVVYEREVAVRMVLVANNDQIIYTNGATDPYTNSDGFAMLDENIATLTAVIGEANYDIGHVFSTGGGGVAYLGAVCETSFKAGGVTGSSAPIGDPYDIDYVAHEIGHQFGAEHSFNGTTDACGGGNRNATTAYEPGSGSTIMAYAGICGSENLQSNSDAYFHGVSFDEIRAFVTTGAGNSCGTAANTGNNPPVVEAGASYSIPANTPFTLTGSATDPNSDALTYNWEQFDLGTASPPNTDNGNRPIFRSFSPTSSPSRTFPRLANILNNSASIGEVLPTTTRTMQFRLTARDNRAGGGGVASDSTSVSVVAAAGPFVVTAPNTAVTWQGGSPQTVTWDVAGTTAAPISCANVRIDLSTDGGTTFAQTVLASTPNDGSQQIVVPNIATTTARLRITCADNIFFDISNANFTIQAVTLPTATIAAGDTPAEPSTNGSFVVTLSAPAPGGGLTVNYSVATGASAATSGVDYVALSGSVTVGAGATSASIPVTVLDDDVADPDETVGVTLTAGTGYILGAPTNASLTIGDEDVASTITATIAAGSAPAEPDSNGSFVVTLSEAAPEGGLTVDYTVATGGSAATSDVDYVALSGSVTVGAGATTANIPVTVLDDDVVDPDETVGVTLAAGSGYTLGAPADASLTIADDDVVVVPVVTVAAGNTPSEPDSDGSFVVTLSAPAPEGGLTVNYTVGTGSNAATPDVDYAALSGSIVIPAGATTVSIPLILIADDVFDPGETVTITLIAGAGYTVGTSSSATLTIDTIYRVFTPLLEA